MVNRSHQNQADLARQLEESQRSLRDEFAMAAMAAIVGCFYQTMRGKEDAQNDANFDTTMFCRELALDENRATGQHDGANEIAADAYLLADAMLKARQENPNG